MKNNKGIISISEKTNSVVAGLNAKFLKEGRLMTNPFGLIYHSYDSYDIKNDKTPDDSISRFTIDGLKHIFPLIDIELGDNNEIIVENNILPNYFAFIDLEHGDHIEYIKEIMLDIFLIYEKDETKIPPNMYKWYFNK